MKIYFTGIPTQAIISGGEMTKTASGLILKWQLESYSPITEYKVIKYYFSLLPFYLLMSFLIDDVKMYENVRCS